MIFLRADVRLAGLKTETLLGMHIADRLCERYNYDVQITSGVEGEHAPKSLHPVGYAFDFVLIGIKGGTDILVEYRRIADALAKALERDFDVVMESQPLHIHTEYQPKRGYQTID